jgi:membrane associated rhomboid family serine protease
VIIPLGTERGFHSRPIATVTLIALNVAAFAALIASAGAHGGPLGDGSEGVLGRFSFMGIHGPDWWRWITYAFLHSPTDWLHIGGNMLFLWVFGPTVEEKLGHVGFSVLYLLGAVVSAWSHSLVSPAALIGASGAIAAIGGAFIVLAPLAPFRVLVFFLVVGVYTIPAYWVIGFALARDFIGLGTPSGVSNAAHLGGYALGISSTLLLLATGVLKREQRWDIISIFQHRRRLQAFKAASAINQEREQRVLAPTNSKPGSRARAKPESASPDSESIAMARANVSAELARHNLPAAMVAYKDMLAKFSKGGTSIILSRQNQLILANALFQSGDAATALPAYRHFLVQYPRDPEAAHVHLMLALIRTRYVPEVGEARREVDIALATLTDPDDVALANQLLHELGPAPRPPLA